MPESLGTAYVDIEPRADGFGSEASKQIDKELGAPIKKINEQVGTGMSGAFAKVGQVVAVAGIAAFFKSTIAAAGDVNEQVSKVGVVFGTASGRVLQFAKDATASMGSSELEALSAVGTFGNLLRSVGLTSDKAADMSTQMVQLAGDLASFNNVPVGAALDAIRSGLTGETEPLKTFGININDATLKAEAMRLGLDTSGTTLSANTKLQASYSLILAQSTLAQGDFARTADSAANQQRILSAEFANAKAEIGQALLPTFQALLEAGRDLIPVFVGLLGGITDVVDVAGMAIGPVSGFLGTLVGSDVGTFAITAGLAALAIDKVGKIATSAYASVVKMAEGFTTANVAMLGIGLLVGAGLSIYKSIKDDAAAAKEEQERLTKAFTDAGDPTFVLADQLHKLNIELGNTAIVAGGAAPAVDAIADPFGLVTKLGKENIDTMNKVGITIGDVTKAIQGGNLAGLLNIAAEGATKYRAGLKGEELDRFRASNDALIDSLNDEEDASEAARTAATERIKTEVAAAEAQGILTQGYGANAFAASHAGDENARWADVGQQLAAVQGQIKKELDGATVAAQQNTQNWDGYAEAAKRADGATEALTKKVEDLAYKNGISLESAKHVIEIDDTAADRKDALTDANDKLTQAIDNAVAAQDIWLFKTGGAQATEDDVTTAIRNMSKELIDQNGKLVEGAGSFEGNSEAAIKNRAALQTVAERAVDVVNGYDDLGISAVDATAHQQGLAQSAYDNAIAMHAPIEVAEVLRDKILAIPPEHPVAVQVATNGVDSANADIDNAARDRSATISVKTLSAVGGQGQYDAVQAMLLAGVHFGASGAMVGQRFGGHLMVIGEAGQDEAVVPLPPGLLAGLQAVAADALAGRSGARSVGDTTVVVQVQGGIADDAEAQRLGRVVGSTAATVLAQRQMALAIKVG